MSLRVLAIAAMDEDRVIGAGGRVPWHIPEDLRRFAALTKGHAVLMGRKTFDSLAEPYKPLPDRMNIVVTRWPAALSKRSDIVAAHSATGVIEEARAGRLTLPSDQLWIIGGGEIYRQTIRLWDELFLTLVHSKNTGDVFFPEFESDFELREKEHHEACSFLRFVRVRP